MTTHDTHGNPRFCGMPSNAVNEAQRWPDATVSVGVLADSLQDKLNLTDQLDDLVGAMQRWSQHTERLTFTLPEQPITERGVDITLAYREGAHGDGQPFDGAGKVVGHAWFPPDGRIHHDNAEDWTISYRQRVTLHEVGHALGLGHAVELGNVMYPYVTNQTALGPWDLDQIQQRYGVGAIPVDPPPPTPPGQPETPPDLPPSSPSRPPMLWGVRRETITIDGQVPDPDRMIKMWIVDSETGLRIAESAYFEDGFFLFEIPECYEFGVLATSPVETRFEGPWPWISGALFWQPGLDFVTLAPDEPVPDDWLPWRTAEMRLPGVTKGGPIEIRFLDTRGSAEGLLERIAREDRQVREERIIPDSDGGL